MSLMEDGAFRWHRPNSNILAGRAEILVHVQIHVEIKPKVSGLRMISLHCD